MREAPRRGPTQAARSGRAAAPTTSMRTTSIRMRLCVLLLLQQLTALAAGMAVNPPTSTATGAASPVDPHASHEAAQLLDRLRTIARSDAFIFGHHNTNSQGQSWSDSTGRLRRSDVATATGVFPGMWGYNLASVATGKTNYSGLVTAMRAQAKGAVLHMFWEAGNPATGGSANDLTGSPITAILPGGSANARWVQWMDNVADFFLAVDVPAAIFRPFHENTGAWFWWGTNASTPEQYRAAWNYTTDYIVKTRGVHTILLAYAPSKPTQSKATWDLAYGDGAGSLYPGDDRVDIACFDNYGAGDYSQTLLQDCEAVVGFASAKGKVPAICESGVKQGTQNTNISSWFMSAFLDPVVTSSACARVAFTYTWRNSKPDSYWVPLQGQATWESFVEFERSPHTIFAGDARLL
jgi:mannan endo-1,4-beta-mannosidase